MNSSKILITGAAGFIGYHLCKSLLEDGYEVLGIDNLNDYYDTNLKQARLEQLKQFNLKVFYLTKWTSQTENLLPNHSNHLILKKLLTSPPNQESATA